MIKEELLGSLFLIEVEDDVEMDKAVKHTKESQEAITTIKRYEETHS